MDFLMCLCYYALLGIFSFILGRLIARHSFDYSRFPFKSAAFEREGLIYKKLGVHKWQTKVPDMSRILPKLMPEKKLRVRPDRKTLRIMINETAVAEIIHWLLIILGAGAMLIMPGWRGALIWVIYILVNVPDIIIQRYNRPRLIKLMELTRE